MIGSPIDPGSELTTDIIQPFQLDLANVRGRAVRLGAVLDEVFGRHAYPPRVEQCLAEAIISTVLLASLLKYDGVFTLQAKGDGPVSLLVADVTTGGAIRAYARFEEDRLTPEAGAGSADLLGQGYLAFTVDQGENTEGYQGIVALTGGSLAESLTHYFDQSEQLPTIAKLAARQYPDGWRAGAVLIQRLPENDAGRIQKGQEEDEEDWRRTTILLNTVADVELLDRTLLLNGLLYRLFHEEGVRVYDPGIVSRGCRCSATKVEQVLQSIPRAELEDLKIDGEVVVTCEFCSASYRYDDAALDRLHGGGTH
jgi:molecular chaperone Hsp33